MRSSPDLIWIMVSFIYMCLTWRPGFLHATVVLIDTDNARMLVAASNKQKLSSCQNNTLSAWDRLGHTEKQLDTWEERQRRVKTFWDPSTHSLDCFRPPLSPLPPPYFSFSHSGNPKWFKLEIRSLISSLDVALGCPGLIIPLIKLPFIPKHKYTLPHALWLGFFFSTACCLFFSRTLSSPADD